MQSGRWHRRSHKLFPPAKVRLRGVVQTVGGIGKTDVLVDRVLGAIAAGGDRNPVRPLEHPAIKVVLLDTISAFVHEPVMARAEQHQIVQAGLATC